MDSLERLLEQATRPALPQRKDYKIGIIGAGFIVEHCHLVAYQKAGFTPYAITSLDVSHSQRLAGAFRIPKTYASWQEMVCDPQIEIIDIAVPPHIQLEIVRFICGNHSPAKNVKAILCQKPLAMSLEAGREIVRLSKESGIPIAVNSNMRYDPSIRALKYILDNQLIGTPVLASIDMRAIPDWQQFLQQYKKLELYAMAIHHIDAFRFLFGNPIKVTAVCRTDPRTAFEHTDGITQYTFQYANGLIATSLDDVWAWPGEPCAKNNYINWRVEGTDGLAEGDFGWAPPSARILRQHPKTGVTRVSRSLDRPTMGAPVVPGCVYRHHGEPAVRPGTRRRTGNQRRGQSRHAGLHRSLLCLYSGRANRLSQ